MRTNIIIGYALSLVWLIIGVIIMSAEPLRDYFPNLNLILGIVFIVPSIIFFFRTRALKEIIDHRTKFEHLPLIKLLRYDLILLICAFIIALILLTLAISNVFFGIIPWII